MGGRAAWGTWCPRQRHVIMAKLTTSRAASVFTVGNLLGDALHVRRRVRLPSLTGGELSADPGVPISVKSSGWRWWPFGRQLSSRQVTCLSKYTFWGAYDVLSLLRGDLSAAPSVIIVIGSLWRLSSLLWSCPSHCGQRHGPNCLNTVYGFGVSSKIRTISYIS